MYLTNSAKIIFVTHNKHTLKPRNTTSNQPLTVSLLLCVSLADAHIQTMNETLLVISCLTVTNFQIHY